MHSFHAFVALNFLQGPAVFYVDSDGTRIKGDLFSVGSGSTFAYGVLDQGYRWDLTDEEAQELGRRSIYAAGHRDAFSGNTINLYHVKEDGWKFIGTCSCASAKVSCVDVELQAITMSIRCTTTGLKALDTRMNCVSQASPLRTLHQRPRSSQLRHRRVVFHSIGLVRYIMSTFATHMSGLSCALHVSPRAYPQPHPTAP